MVWTSSNVGSEVRTGRDEWGNPLIISSTVRAEKCMFVVVFEGRGGS
jgi:hypothetical protein